MTDDQNTATGGNLSQVSFRGNNVLRDMKPHSPTIHRLLLHLQNKGLKFVPRFLGQDGAFEVLSYMPGKTADDYPLTCNLNQQILAVRAAARMLRQLHDATVDFPNTAEDKWFLSYTGTLEKEVICHNDFAPYNTTFSNGLPVGVIDFDTACPAPRVWDIAYAVYRFVPFSHQTYEPAKGSYRPYDKNADAHERTLLFDAFLSEYGYVDKQSVAENTPLRLQALVDLFDAKCIEGDPAFIRMRDQGHQQFYRDEIVFIKNHISDWISCSSASRL